MPNATLSLLIIHTASTWFMVGLIWFVQVVHYPLMAQVGAERWVGYERAHTRLTTWVVMPAMLIELASALLLAAIAWGIAPMGSAALATPRLLPTCGVTLIVAIWLSTFAIQVPCHSRLERGWDAAMQRRLARSNWIRTALWSVRGVLAAAMLAP